MKKGYYINILIIMVLSVIISGCDFNMPKKEEEEHDTVIINSAESSNLLNLGIDTVDTFNPLFTSSFSVYDAMQLIFEPLFSFDEDELSASENPITLPPSSIIAASKLSLVLVDGSKNSVASFLPLHFSLYFPGLSIMSFAVLMSWSSSSTEKSSISIRLLITLPPR